MKVKAGDTISVDNRLFRLGEESAMLVNKCLEKKAEEVGLIPLCTMELEVELVEFRKLKEALDEKQS